MIDLNEIHSLTEFQRNTREHVERLKSTGEPQVLTVNGRAEVIVQDATAYQKLLEKIDRLEALAGIKRGLDDVEEGRTKPAEQVFDAIRKKHKIPKS
jgi:PHD/YefM family antitoxin component YafN of YafNO toxin-antitoxin module